MNKRDRPPTAPDNISVSAQGFSDAVQAERFAGLIVSMVRSVSRYIRLERLDGITVAFDYNESLAQLNRGYQPARPLARTSDDQLIGVAMAPAVLRNGMVKGHLMFYAPAILSLQDESSETFHEALYLVAHECAHIEDLTHRDECFPGVIIQREMSVYESLVEPVAGRFWEEYAACRVSAVFDESRTSLYEDGLIKVLQVAHDGANDAIRSYRLHGDLDRVLQEAGCPLCEPLRLAAYLMGHIDGLDEGFDSVPQAREWISKSSYSRLVDRLRARLRQLWSRRGHWTSIAEFEPLRDIVRDVLADGGINLTRLSDGTVRVDIPFSRETMPS